MKSYRESFQLYCKKGKYPFAVCYCYFIEVMTYDYLNKYFFIVFSNYFEVMTKYNIQFMLLKRKKKPFGKNEGHDLKKQAKCVTTNELNKHYSDDRAHSFH